MSPTFLNTNLHRVYVDDPEVSQGEATVNGIYRFPPGAEVEASGRFAELLAETPGVVTKGSEAGKAYTSDAAVAERALVTGGFGPQAFPAVEPPRIPEGAEGGSGKDLSELKVAELRALAKRRGIAVEGKKGRPTKAQFIAALSGKAQSGTLTSDKLPKPRAKKRAPAKRSRKKRGKK